MFVQAINPVPVIPSTPGWCLQYVREAYGITPGVYPTASAGWLASPTKHRDKDFPAGCAVPLWFAMEGVPAGHVVLRLADGSIYSTTEAEAKRPTLHPDLDHLMGVYARAGLPLTYLGWTEDIENTRIIVKQTIQKEDDFMASIHDLLVAPAYDGGPQVSEVLRSLDRAAMQVNAIHEAIFNNDGTNESILGGFSISGLDNHNAVKILDAIGDLAEKVGA